MPQPTLVALILQNGLLSSWFFRRGQASDFPLGPWRWQPLR